MYEVKLFQDEGREYNWDDLKNNDIVQSNDTGNWYLVKKHQLFAGLIGLGNDWVYTGHTLDHLFQSSKFTKLSYTDVLTLMRVDE